VRQRFKINLGFGEVIMENIIDLAKSIKDKIDWEYDLYSGYQKMMREIDDIADMIIYSAEHEGRLHNEP
jgi:predicted RNA-binding protein